MKKANEPRAWSRNIAVNIRLFLCLVFILITGCENEISPSGGNKANRIETGIGNLDKLMSIPATPLEVKWQINEEHRSGNGSLQALFKFAKEDKKKIINESEVFDAIADDRISAEIYDGWLPEDAKKGLIVEKTGDLYVLKQVNGLKANLFTQTELSPYVNGSITLLGDGYIFVSLYSM